MKRFIGAFLVLLVIATPAVAYNKRHQIYAQLLLSRVAHQSNADEATTDEAKALRVLDEVLRIGQIDPRQTVPVDDSPAWILASGLGFCDGTAMAFIQVAERVGLRGRLLFLMNDEGVSPHAVAAVEIDGEWRIIDVLKRTVSRRPDGEIATAADIASGAAPTTAPDVRAGWFENPTVFFDTGSTETLREKARKVVLAFADVTSSVAGPLVQDLYLMTPPPRVLDVRGERAEDWSTPEGRVYWKARNYDVFGRSEEARSLYEELRGGEHRDEATIFLRAYHLDSRHEEVSPSP